ncbi:TRAP transporter substrate-binding protein DctP [Lacrimispora sp. 210928-DFI.3.58]|nr:TRAP transporter substrate-binding protein DctP [Lacrimispora sp. 210928-DFI.3.58]
MKKMIRQTCFGMVAMMGILMLAGCGSGNTGSSNTSQTTAAAEQKADAGNDVESGSPSIEKLTLVTTTSQVTGGPTQMLQEAITKAAEGNEMFEFTHYDNSTLFKSSEEFQALMDHDVDIAFLPTSYLYDNGALWCDMYSMTYLFDSPQQIAEFFDPYSETGKTFAQKVYDEFHFWPITSFDLSTRNVWLAKDKDVRTPDDLKGILCRVPNGASWVKMGQSIGVSATSLDSNEVYLGMQTGTIEAQENNMISSYANALQEVTKTIVLTGHQYNFNLVCVAGDVWDALNDAQKDELTRVIVEAVKENDAAVQAKEADILKECEERGIRIQTPDVEAFKTYAREFYLASEEAKDWDMDTYNTIISSGN